MDLYHHFILATVSCALLIIILFGLINRYKCRCEYECEGKCKKRRECAKRWAKRVDYAWYGVAFITASTLLSEYISFSAKEEIEKLSRQVREAVSDVASDVISLRDYCNTYNKSMSVRGGNDRAEGHISIAPACGQIYRVCRSVETWVFDPLDERKNSFAQTMADNISPMRHTQCKRIDQVAQIYAGNLILDLTDQIDKNAFRWSNISAAINLSASLLEKHEIQLCLQSNPPNTSTAAKSNTEQNSTTEYIDQLLENVSPVIRCSSKSKLPNIKRNEKRFDIDFYLTEIYRNDDLMNHSVAEYLGVLQGFGLFYVLSFLGSLKIAKVRAELIL